MGRVLTVHKHVDSIVGAADGVEPFDTDAVAARLTKRVLGDLVETQQWFWLRLVPKLPDKVREAELGPRGGVGRVQAHVEDSRLPHHHPVRRFDYNFFDGVCEASIGGKCERGSCSLAYTVFHVKRHVKQLPPDSLC